MLKESQEWRAPSLTAAAVCRGADLLPMSSKIKDRSEKNLTEAEEIKKRWQEYIEEL